MIDVVNDKYTLMFGDCLERMKAYLNDFGEIRCYPRAEEYQNFER